MVELYSMICLEDIYLLTEMFGDELVIEDGKLIRVLKNGGVECKNIK